MHGNKILFPVDTAPSVKEGARSGTLGINFAKTNRKWQVSFNLSYNSSIGANLEAEVRICYVTKFCLPGDMASLCQGWARSGTRGRNLAKTNRGWRLADSANQSCNSSIGANLSLCSPPFPFEFLGAASFSPLFQLTAWPKTTR